MYYCNRCWSEPGSNRKYCLQCGAALKWKDDSRAGFYDEDDIRQLTLRAMELHNRAAARDNKIFVDVQNFALSALRRINDNAGNELYSNAYDLEYSTSSGRYNDLINSIEECVGRALRNMIKNFKPSI